MAKFIINATITIDGATIKNGVDADYQTKVIMARYKMLSIPSDAEINIVANETHQHFPCPFCGADNTTYDGDGEYICEECKTIFREDDVIAEPIRHKLSALLSANHATEGNPMPCDIPINEWVRVVGISESQDGIIYFDLANGLSEEFDFMGIPELRTIETALNL